MHVLEYQEHFLKLCMASDVVLTPLLEVYILLYIGRAAGFEPELVKLVALPRFQ
jgi:hypothetical protein